MRYLVDSEKLSFEKDTVALAHLKSRQRVSPDSYTSYASLIVFTEAV